MKQILITLSFVILSLAVASCKKSDDVDPRDQYVGTYNVTMSSLSGYTNLGIPASTKNESDLLVVSKDSDPTDLIFSIAQNRFTARVSNGNSFTILPLSVPAKNSNGTEYQINYDGDGAFSDKYITGYIAWNYTTSGYTTKSIITMKGVKK